MITTAGKGMKTLLVEDDATTRRFLQEMLEALGHAVIPCATAREGLAAFEKEPVPLIVIDWLMPEGELDGLELVRRVRDLPGGNATFIVVVTVRREPGDLEAVLDAGADDYIPKPVAPEDFRVRLRIARARIRDHAARTSAERALEASEERLRTVVAHAPLILFVLDKHGLFTFAAGQGLNALALEAEQVVGQSVFDVYRGEAEIAAQVSRALGGETFLAETSVRGVNLEAWFAPIPDGGGAIIVATDISRRKHVESQLREGEERFRRFAEAAFEGIVLLENQRIVDANQQIAEIFGHQVPDVIGRPVFDFIAPSDRERTEEYFTQQRAEPFEVEGVHQSGTPLQLEIRVRPVTSGNRDLVVAAVMDVTTRRKAESEHKWLEEQFRQAQKLESLGVLAGGIAHDFNNLLMGVLGNASLALMDVPSDSPTADHIHQIETAAQRAADLTNQMLAFSGKGKFVITKINLSRYIHELEPIVTGVLSRGVEVQYRLDDDLPDIEGDAAQVRQLLMNLVRNASDAMDERGGIIRISTGIRHVTRSPTSGAVMAGEVREGFHVYLEVRDTGAGMDEATMARVFDPFFTTKFMGRGLGMAAALGIVRGHNGAIRVVSRPRQGTTVTIFFPPATSDIPKVPAPRDATDKDKPRRFAVLVVDDEETVRSVTAKMLERSGYEVLVAQCGQEGLDVFQANQDRVTLVLLDLTMPDVMGDQVFQQLRQLKPDVRVILMSGYDEKEATVQFGEDGLAGFIQKPFSAKQLRSRVEGVLNGEIEAETNGKH